jgi:hypothetical protein
MAPLSNIRGMLLEEILLYLLESTGYKTVEAPRNDPTLESGPAGIMVRGRGGSHQIDAIADFEITHPFSHPARLLVEAKCFSRRKRVGIDIVRAAVGTLKDVAEYWIAGRGAVPKERYHYQYAVFSATGYSKDAQRYAFAQDIYLIPLGHSLYFTPVIEAIRQIRPMAAPSQDDDSNLDLNMKQLRSAVRDVVRNRTTPERAALDGPHFGLEGLGRFCAEARRIRFALLAILGKRFPIFLVPAPMAQVQGFRDEYDVQIFRGENDQNWVLRDQRYGRDLFSFDIPKELFLQFAKQGMLTPEAALDLKESVMSSFHAFHVQRGEIRLIRFRLDQNWVNSLRERLKGVRA